MLDLGFSEILVILVFVLLIFGPEKLPEIARTLGKYYSQLMKYKEYLDEEIKKGMLEADSTPKKESVKKGKSKTVKNNEVDEDIKSLAESLGISTEGKTRKQIIEEIKEKTVVKRDESKEADKEDE